ncbi:amidase [Alsobacter soli]|uniref:Amidase n=1 Tax=Alsobacter soli TaxID=2109933 RepID=A0A2T1HN44_9HYPH|nr:acetamidase/formamidase family protein [Alsobacter soli]PSC03066.1 amidase [Alsobacter soli]
MSQHHDLPFRPDTMVWGTFDAAIPPAIEIDSGDTVSMHALPACISSRLPKDPSYDVPGLLLEAMKTLPQGPSSHFVSGPVAVRGAQPGDVLQVDILEVEPWMDWGYMTIQPLKGTLPDDFPEASLIHPRIDREAGMIRMLPGLDVPLDPFFGVMGVAPPPAWGAQPTMVPQVFGGNLDNKELRAGATLFLPVLAPGALFSAGDGHGAQGDGEVCLTGLETGLRGRFRLTVRRELGWAWPFAETGEHLISMGMNEDLDDAARQAVREMIAHIVRRTTLSREQAYMLCSLAGDLHVTQTVDGNKGVHMMLRKALLAGVQRA